MDGKNVQVLFCGVYRKLLMTTSWMLYKEFQTRLHDTMLLLYNYPLPPVDEWWVDLWGAQAVFALAMTSDTNPLATSSSLSLPCINNKSQLY